jgi:hypothetical protein
MHRILIGVMCLMMIFIFGITLEVAGQDSGDNEQSLENMLVPMGVIVLKPDESVEQKKTPVEFYHSKHFVYDCKTCHHKWEGNTKIVNCSTSDCHDLLKSPKKPTKYLSYTDTGIKYYKYAFHQQCVGCHKEIKIKRKKMEMSYKTLEVQLPKTGPTGCKECHPKLEE